jgi:hypothetical protein
MTIALLGRISVGADNDSLNIGASSLTLSAGVYYTAGYTGEGSQLVDELQTQIRTIAN